MTSCVNCGAPIRALPTARYCSAEPCRKARQREQNQNRGKPRPPRPCAECGRIIPDDRRPPILTCSETCATERERATYRRHYRKLAANPEFNRARHADRRAQLQADPAAWAAYKAAEHERAVERWRSLGPRQRDQQKGQMREWYAANAERVQQQRREHIETLPEDAFADYIATRREYARRYAARLRAALSLNEIASNGAELITRMETPQ